MKSAKKQKMIANAVVFAILGLVFIISIFPVLYTRLCIQQAVYTFHIGLQCHYLCK